MNRQLSDVTHLIIDEVHERDIETELLLLLIKHLLKSNKDPGSTNQSVPVFYLYWCTTNIFSLYATVRSLYP